MDEQRPLRNRESFVIRLWQREAESSQWLGQVQHTYSGKIVAVRGLDELVSVLRGMLEETAVLDPEDMRK